MSLFPFVLLSWAWLTWHAAVSAETAAPPPCRMVFSLNPGRSGSEYLARILALAQGVDAGHERAPTLFGRVLRRAKALGLEATRKERGDLKVPTIRHVLDGGQIYAETSHAFGKTLWDLVLGPHADRALSRCRVDVILLRRHPRWRVACSLYRRNWTAIHEDWLLEPGSALATLAPPTVPGQPLHELDAVLWYLDDAEAHTRRLVRQYAGDPRVRFHRVELDQIQTDAGVDRLFAAMGLRRASNHSNSHDHPVPAAAWAVVGRPQNANRGRGAEVPCDPMDVAHRTRIMRQLRPLPPAFLGGGEGG